uniref:Uncharacterized protein n=1 Tax=Pyxicephalus adspersus TaxID=30357 RepID=A0AAV3AXR7_PYXAD|nr:TPA: hypothetical protein GDO54_008066 [Pyxicephalus adspersus]
MQFEPMLAPSLHSPYFLTGNICIFNTATDLYPSARVLFYLLIPKKSFSRSFRCRFLPYIILYIPPIPTPLISHICNVKACVGTDALAVIELLYTALAAAWLARDIKRYITLLGWVQRADRSIISLVPCFCLDKKGNLLGRNIILFEKCV